MAAPHSIGAEEARKLFPSLVESASRGTTTIITKHGRPCAAVVPVALARAPQRRGERFLDLCGTGKGLYGGAGNDAAKYINKLRAEWD